jgi:hypothetical protein
MWLGPGPAAQREDALHGIRGHEGTASHFLFAATALAHRSFTIPN